MGTCTSNQTERIHTEDLLDRGCRDFSASYMAVKYLASHIRNHPKTITPRTIDVLVEIIESPRFDRQKQVFFLYAEATDALIIMACQTQNPLAATIIPRLLTILSHARGRCLSALSQRLGSLPVPLAGDSPYLPRNPGTTSIPLEINLETLASGCHEMTWQGRSLRVNRKHQDDLVIKFAVSRENIPELVKEIRWMEFLKENNPDPEVLLPAPLNSGEQILFKVKGSLPRGGPDTLIEGICIIFTPCLGYYTYPNELPGTWSRERVKTIFFKNARFLGYLSRMGVFHTAVIPLFHNRVQQSRRNDGGAYLWEHGGRLDQWLDSCRYPNFAASGPRDFEHLVLAENSRKLGHYIGEHLLSFILVMGSFFRNKDPWRRGKDGNHPPCDTRDLFSGPLFKEMLDGVCRAYFQGLVLKPCPRDMDFAPQALIDALIFSMGQDTYMQETLRARDQNEMTDKEFKAFLKKRGITRSVVRGEGDIVMDTGPHLGGFNQPISIPQLIDHLFRFSAFCTAHSFLTHA